MKKHKFKSLDHHKVSHKIIETSYEMFYVSHIWNLKNIERIDAKLLMFCPYCSFFPHDLYKITHKKFVCKVGTHSLRSRKVKKTGFFLFSYVFCLIDAFLFFFVLCVWNVLFFVKEMLFLFFLYTTKHQESPSPIILK